MKGKLATLNKVTRRSSDFKILITAQGWLVIAGWIILALFNNDNGKFNTNSFLYKATIFLTIAVVLNVIMVGLVKQFYGMKSDKEETPELVQLKKALFIAEDIFGLVQMFGLMRGKNKPDFHFTKNEVAIQAVNSLAEKRFRDSVDIMKVVHNDSTWKQHKANKTINPFSEEAELLRKAASEGSRYLQEDNR